jgi:hypothetical protein
MSVRNSAFAIAAYALIGQTAPAIPAVPVLDTLLNDYKVSELHAVQIDDAGRCVVLVAVAVGSEAATIRPVCNALGDVRLYGDIGAVAPIIKRARLEGSAQVQFYRKERAVTLGDPVATLKSQYKAFKAEKAVVDKSKVVLDAKITAAAALGWDTSSNTAEAAEYADFLARRASTDEAIAFCAGRVTALAASLTAAGVDPLTVV